jgi:ribonucleoside-diphosphate reductase alpha chain
MQHTLDESPLITDPRTNDDIFETEISEEVYQQNYRYGEDDRVPDTWYRNARALAAEEENPDLWTQKFYELLSGQGLPTGPFPFTPGGRIFANAGTGLESASLINCFVAGFRGEDQDSMDEIQNELTRQAKILASEGGYGFCASVMRPRGARIGGVGSMTPGSVRMLDCWNEQAATIVAGSGMDSDRDDVKDKIRKGAQMVTLHCWHPDLIEFIEAKQESGRLHKFNMSVLVTDDFMKAVRNDEKWTLRFPDFEGEPDFYEKHWSGNLKEYEAKGGTVKTWHNPATGEKAEYRARDIWNKIMRSTYERNEPGVLFVDKMNKENNLGYEEHIDATNPCGEQILPPGGVCLLGNFNTTQLLKEDHSEFNYDLLAELVPRAVRFLDNVNDRAYVPTEKQRWNLKNKRRIGLGHFGDGSALTMMKVRYGSDEGVRVMREFQENLANMAYQASAQLAKEKGAFPLFDKDEYLNNSPFIARLFDKTKAMIAEHGLRNSHLLSIQPTGNTSTLANAPSSGVEPVFMHSYVRTAEQPALPEGVVEPVPFSWDELKDGQVIGSDTGPNPTTMWRAEEQGDELVLRCEEDGHTHWQLHPTRGIVKDQTVEDYARRTMNGEFDAEADWTVTTRDLDVDDHLAQMKALAPFIDSSMSKTVNVPNDYPFEDFKGLYEKAYDATAVKGVTTYRAGTMSAVLSGENDEEEDIPRTEAPERPDTLDCAIHRVRFRGDNWKILVGFYEGTPYEVFAFTTFGEVRIVDSEGNKLTEGRIRKAGSGQYELLASEGDDKVIVEDIASKAPNDNVKHETRLVSTSLRHGAKIDFLVSQLKKAEGSIASFGTSLAKALQAHAKTVTPTCDKCGSDNVRMVESCMTCADCGHSHCS